MTDKLNQYSISYLDHLLYHRPGLRSQMSNVDLLDWIYTSQIDMVPHPNNLGETLTDGRMLITVTNAQETYMLMRWGHLLGVKLFSETDN